MSKKRGPSDEEDEDALTTMVDRPVLFFGEEEDDSDLDSTQLEWVSPLDPDFGDGRPPPERFPADEPLTPPRQLAKDFGEAMEDTNATVVGPSPNLEVARPPAEESQDLDASDLVPALTPPPASRRPSLVTSRVGVPTLDEPPDARRLSPRVPSLSDGPTVRAPQASAKVKYDSTRFGVPALRRSLEGPPSRDSSDPDATLRMVTAGLVVGVVLALLVLAIAAGWWYAMA
ncbi:MAG: hypothetical protein AAGA48_40495 [Myxococcota bacterium]